MIRPLAEVSGMGSVGRSKSKLGGVDGSAPNFQKSVDMVTLGESSQNYAPLYSPTPIFKMMGAVQLLVPDQLTSNRTSLDASAPVL